LSPIHSGVAVRAFALIVLGASLAIGQDKPASLDPFGANPKLPDRKITIGKQAPFRAAVELQGDTGIQRWQISGDVLQRQPEPMAIQQQEGQAVLVLRGSVLEPNHTIVNGELAAANNGDLWAQKRADHLAFFARATAPVRINVYLTYRGKEVGESGSQVAQVQLRGNEWQHVVLPFTQFGMKNSARVAAIGLGVAEASSAQISVRDLTAAAALCNDDTWKTHRHSISLQGQWRFAPDAAGEGEAAGWASAAFDDSGWRTLKSGAAWQDQGVQLGGFGWYRQKLFVPQPWSGVPLILTLADIPYTDDVYINGTRVGGVSGNYKYTNHSVRRYAVPASVIRYGEANSIVVRVWGVDGAGSEAGKSGLVAGEYTAELDPYRMTLRRAGTQGDEPLERFDFSDAQRDLPFDLVVRFPAELPWNPEQTTVRCAITDYYGNTLGQGESALRALDAASMGAVVQVDRDLARVIYQRGRFKVFTTVTDADGAVLYCGQQEADRLCFARRDATALPPLAKTELHETPYGRLRLVDEIDCTAPSHGDEHPYMESGYDGRARRMTPGAPLKSPVREILGKPAREPEYGWFAYRIGRGQLKPRQTYLLRIEYPEDKPRYCPIEIQTGHNFVDVGWKNGVSSDDPYDNWPLSQSWQWYDTIVTLDDETTGWQSTGGGSAQHGFWVYVMNKLKPQRYFIMYSGGPAVARMRLYEIDVDQHAPTIRLPQGLPQRTLMLDWERQVDHEPIDLVRYARLMGYNAIAPIVLKWAFMNYADPVAGYETIDVDRQGFWVRRIHGEYADKPAPRREPSRHDLYLRATKQLGVNYVPRIEYGGSRELPVEARAIGGDGDEAQPNRFAPWCANLLHPATWDDLSRTLDGMIKPHVADNPQMTGILWRIRSDRMQISFGRRDVELFCRETGVTMPDFSSPELADWACSGPVAHDYADWWHGKRAQFHARVRDLLRSYRGDMRLYYYNWDNDKWWLGLHDTNAAAAFAEVSKTRPGVVPRVYQRNLTLRRKLLPEDYVTMIRTGELGEMPGWGVDYGLRPELYRDLDGIELFAPANYLYLADNPTYLNYFQTREGLAMSHAVSYDEMASRYINPKYEGNMITPAGPTFSMAMEVLAWYHGDARTVTYTAYTYGRGFADAHRRFAQAFLALPAIAGQDVPGTPQDVKARVYASPQGTYVGVAFKGYQAAKLVVRLPQRVRGSQMTDLVTGQTVPARTTPDGLEFDIQSPPMMLHAFVVK
jgi:hypothetical protein